MNLHLETAARGARGHCVNSNREYTGMDKVARFDQPTWDFDMIFLVAERTCEQRVTTQQVTPIAKRRVLAVTRARSTNHRHPGHTAGAVIDAFATHPA
jgi:hypothetical protein